MARLLTAFRFSFVVMVTVTSSMAADSPGMEEKFEVARAELKRFETPKLPAGPYLFELSGSNESCVVILVNPEVIHIMVRGHALKSMVRLVGRATT